MTSKALRLLLTSGKKTYFIDICPLKRGGLIHVQPALTLKTLASPHRLHYYFPKIDLSDGDAYTFRDIGTVFLNII